MNIDLLNKKLDKLAAELTPETAVKHLEQLGYVFYEINEKDNNIFDPHWLGDIKIELFTGTEASFDEKGINYTLAA